MDSTNNEASAARKKRKLSMMNKKQQYNLNGKENIPHTGQSSTQGLRTHSFSPLKHLEDPNGCDGNTQPPKRQCRKKTNSFLRPVAVNLLNQFQATNSDFIQQQISPRHSSIDENVSATTSFNNNISSQHSNELYTNHRLQAHDLDSSSDDLSNGDSDSDVDGADDYSVDDHLQDIGDPVWECQFCFACMWYGERMYKSRNTTCPTFSRCCHGGKVKLPMLDDPPLLLKQLLSDTTTINGKNYQSNTRTYNAMFSFTSLDMKFDTKFSKGGGPPTLRLHGQVCHRIGALLPEIGQPPKYAQLYIFDTDNEFDNRIECFRDNKNLDRSIVAKLKEMLDHNNVLAKAFRMARDMLKNPNVKDLKLRLISDCQTDGRVYNKPTISEVAALIVVDVDSGTKRDIIIQERGGNLQRIDEFHPSYHAFQYPLLFPYGEDGYRDNILHAYKGDVEVNKRNRQTIMEWLSYRLQERKSEAKTLLTSRRLFHQFLVDRYTMMETERLNWLGKNQSKLRVGKYHKLKENDLNSEQNTTVKSGKRVVLPSSFVGSKRYMDQLYFDGMV